MFYVTPGEGRMVSEPHIVTRRARAQRLLDTREGSVIDVVRHLAAVQAQDPAAVPLAVRARSTGTSLTELHSARADATIVRCWGPRGTLHLIATDDLAWLYPLVRPGVTTSARRLAELGVHAELDRAADTVVAALAGRGPVGKPELGELLARRGLRAEGQAIVHLALLGAARGEVVLGPEHAGKPTYVHAGDWLGRPLPVETDDRDAGLRELVARYRTAHDPAGPADLAAWSGLAVGEVNRAWQGSSTSPEDTPGSLVRLVPAFDEYLLGWRDRSPILPEAYRRLIHPGGGIIKSALLVDGRVAGTWRIRRGNDRLTVTVEPFEALPAAVAAGISTEAAEIAAFLAAEVRLDIGAPLAL